MNSTAGYFVLVSVIGLAASAGVAATAEEESFQGWEGMRVIHQASRSQILRAGDVVGDGREELAVVNTRQLRLDIYRWRDEPEEAVEADPDRPNEHCAFFRECGGVR